MDGGVYALPESPLRILTAPAHEPHERFRTSVTLHVVNTAAEPVGLYACRGAAPVAGSALYWGTKIQPGAALSDSGPHVLVAGESLWCWASAPGLSCSVTWERRL